VDELGPFALDDNARFVRDDRDVAFQMAERRSSEDVELGEKTIGQEARLMNRMLAIVVAFFLAASPTTAFAGRVSV
jgi:hypothetical protein